LPDSRFEEDRRPIYTENVREKSNNRTDSDYSMV